MSYSVGGDSREDLGHSADTVCLSSGPAIPRDPAGSARRSGQGEGSLGFRESGSPIFIQLVCCRNPSRT